MVKIFKNIHSCWIWSITLSDHEILPFVIGNASQVGSSPTHREYCLVKIKDIVSGSTAISDVSSFIHVTSFLIDLNDYFGMLRKAVLYFALLISVHEIAQHMSHFSLRVKICISFVDSTKG